MSISQDSKHAVFLQGSVLRHVLVMTATGSIGLMAVFVVDLLSLIYISWLGDPHLTAGVGFATQLSFFYISFQVGLSIAIGALVARSIGAGDRAEARRIAASAMVHVGIISLILSLASLPLLKPVLEFTGAKGETYDAAMLFMLITVPSNVLLALGMASSSVLRAVGDARRSMYVLLSGAIITAALDPILILVLRFDVAGAAATTVIARLCYAGIGFWGVVRVHNMLGGVSTDRLRRYFWPLLAIALPAIAANLAAPVSTTYALKVFASFGEQVVAAIAIVDRLVPVAFGATFAMSGAVGPVVGQNFGAKRFDRVRATLMACYGAAIVYGLSVWALLAILAPLIAQAFGATGETADLVIFYCRIGAGAWLFLGCLFAANSAFNNLGYPALAMIFNWGRATLGTIPFVTIGAHYAGPKGGIAGMGIGAAIFGIVAIVVSFGITKRLEARMANPVR